MPRTPLRILSSLTRASLLCAALATFLPVLRAQTPRLINLSTRAQVGTGGDILITGFNITGTGNKTVLIRATGPALTPFGVTGVLADPKLELYSGTTLLQSNDNWLAADAATFSSVGAFALTGGSKDAALVATLAPGGYTAQVSGIGAGTGVALVEVYEVGSGTAQLTNLSSRALVGTGGNILIPGIVISAGSGTRTLLVRAIGPTLTSFGVAGALADPTMTISTSTGTVVATNDNWGTAVGSTAASATTLAAAFTQAGAFLLTAGTKDAAVLADFAPGSYTVQVSGVGNTTGVALVEVYDVTPTGPATVSVAATKSSADETGANPGEFTITRTGDTLSALTVRYAMSGTASNAFDYANLAGSVVIPSGSSSVKIALTPLPDTETESTETATLTLLPDPAYTVAPAAIATVSIADSPATLYVATLRPEGSATNSTSSGTATILLSTSGTLASVTVTFTNLSSAEVSAHLRIGPSGDFVFNLPAGQVSGSQWNFSPTGVYTSTDLLNALKTGNIFVGIDSANYPSGEVRGTFLQGTGSQVFTAPAAPPAFSLANVTAADAARLLTQATFGPKQSEIDALTGGNIDTWITAQLAMPFTSHRTAILADHDTYGGSNSFTNWNALTLSNRQSAWWKNILTAPDQLRQRVAFALSEILVVSDISLGNDNQAEPLANYYDILGNGAFGNFRTLLENVTLNPMMGNYLSSLRNAKADPVTGQTPDENYAREVMQLFTIGLNKLQPDGTLVLDASGLPVATYNQTTITEMAKVFTGWSYFGTTNFRSGGGSVPSFTNPMILFPAAHDDTVKNIVNGVIIPANQGGAKDLQLALDALFNHPNTGPFIAKLLIQRLVTSNPSPAYVYRVAQKFENNGAGVRGDLSAVVRAIFTDYEARSPAVAANLTFGKLKEPLLRLTNLLRSFNASAPNGRYLGVQVTVNGANINGSTPIPALSTSILVTSSATRLDNVQVLLAEASLRSPTVFNFFHPGYVLPGALAAAGLVAPEYEITDATFSIDVPNYLRTFIFTTNTAGTAQALVTVAPDFTAEQALSGTPAALLDHLNAVLCQGAMPQATRDRVITALAALPAATTPLERVQSAVLLVLTSPSSAIQK